jgi:hypothetical protein
MKVDPMQNNVIVTPHKYAGQSYDFNQGRICNLGDNINAVDDVRTQIYNNEPATGYTLPTKGDADNDKITGDEHPFLLKEDPVTLEWVNKLAEFKTKDPVLKHSGGAGKENNTNDVGTGLDNDPDLAELLAMDGNTANSTVETDDEMGSEFEEFEDVADIDAENIKEYGTVQKIRQIAVPELERTFKESILRGHIKKQKEEQMPQNLRRMNQDKINKEVNMISLIKSQVTLENKSVKLHRI